MHIKYGRGWGFLVVDVTLICGSEVTPFPKVNLHSHFLSEDTVYEYALFNEESISEGLKAISI